MLPLKEAEDAIRAGRVQLDSVTVREPMAPLSSTSRVSLDGHPVSLQWKTRVLLFHKPSGVVSHGTHRDGGGTVFDALMQVLPHELTRFGWHAVGRLDLDTTGLLLFTNDERFVAHATAPETHLPKRYVVTVGRKATDKQLEKLRKGVMIDDGAMTRPAKAQRRGDDAVELTLTEGRFHQVKRMINAVGLPTLALHREAVGGLVIDVALGAFREARDEEVEQQLGFAVRGQSAE